MTDVTYVRKMAYTTDHATRLNGGQTVLPDLRRFKQHVCVLDTSNDIVGSAAQPHFCLGSSRRFQVLARCTARGVADSNMCLEARWQGSQLLELLSSKKLVGGLLARVMALGVAKSSNSLEDVSQLPSTPFCVRQTSQRCTDMAPGEVMSHSRLLPQVPFDGKVATVLRDVAPNHAPQVMTLQDCSKEVLHCALPSSWCHCAAGSRTPREVCIPCVFHEGTQLA